MSDSVLKNSIEAILFVSGQPVPAKRFKEIFSPEFSSKDVDGAMADLVNEWADKPGGLELIEVGGGWRFRTKPELSEWVKRAFEPRPRSLTAASMETLAIIAYRQPIVRPDIEKLRGVDCGGVLKTLLDRNLIKIVGRKEEPGNPMLYATTPQFLELFGLNELSDLPPLKDIDEMRRELAQRSEDGDYDLRNFVAGDDHSMLVFGKPEDDEALSELEGKLKDLRRLEREMFPKKDEEGSSETEANAEGTQGAEPENAGQAGEADS